MASIEQISQVGPSTKYKYDGNLITYRATGIKVDVKGDAITIQNDFLHPKDSQHKIEASFGQLSETYGTNNAEEFVDYLFENSILFSGEASEVISAPEAKKWQVVGDISYFGFAEPGALESDPVWKAMKLDETVVGNQEGKVTWADNGNYTQIATDLTTLTYA